MSPFAFSGWVRLVRRGMRRSPSSSSSPSSGRRLSSSARMKLARAAAHTVEALEERRLLTRSLGIDVSSAQGAINWGQVYHGGVAFAYVRATQGAAADANFAANMTGATSAGVIAGAYDQADFNDLSAAADANHFLSVAGQYVSQGYLRPVLELQGTTTMTQAQVSAWVNDWVQTVYDATKVNTVIYANVAFAANYLDASVTSNQLFIADWNGQNAYTGQPSGTTPWSNWNIWQCSGAGSVPGITGDVDLDVANGTTTGYVIPKLLASSGSPFGAGDAVYVTTSSGLKAWNSYASNGTYTVEANGAAGTIESKPVFINGFARYQVTYADGTTGWSAGAYLAPAWSDTDVGSPTPAGSASFDAAGGTWTVSGGGGGIGGTADQFNLNAQAFNGDGSITANVTSQTASASAGAAAGVMIRDNTSTSSPFAAVILTGDGDVQFQWRPSSGSATLSAIATGVGSAAWVRLTRSGNSFTASYSTDGSTWTQLGLAEQAKVGAAALAGLAVTSGSAGASNTATFAGVAAAAAAAAPLADGDVGSPAVAGRASYIATSDMWTLVGSGVIGGGSSDQFNFASQPFTGDGSIVAKVASLDGDSDSQGGLMFRNDGSASSAFAAVVASANGRVTFLWRGTAGGTVQSLTETKGAAVPVWVELSRQGGTFSAFYSNNGNDWYQLGTAQAVTIGATALAGLAVGGGAAGDAASAAFTTFESPAPLSAPRHVLAQSLGGTDARVTWVPTNGAAASYVIFGSTDGGATWVPVGTAPAGATSAMLRGLQPNVAYLFRVTPTTGGGAGGLTPAAAMMAAPAALAPMDDVGGGGGDYGDSGAAAAGIDTGDEGGGQWYRVSFSGDPSGDSADFTHGHASDDGEGTLEFDQSHWVWAYGEEDAVYQALSGTFTNDTTGQDYDFPDSGAFDYNPDFTLPDPSGDGPDQDLGACVVVEDLFGQDNCDYDYNDDYVQVQVQTISFTPNGTGVVTFAGDGSNFQLGNFSYDKQLVSQLGDGETENELDPQFDAVVDWGDTGTDTVDLNQEDDQSYSAEGEHEFDQPGAYVATSEILMEDGDQIVPATFLASYIEVRPVQDDAQLQSDAGHDVSSDENATFGLDVEMDGDSGDFTVSGSGDVDFSLSQQMDTANEGVSPGLDREENGGNVEFDISADGSFDTSPDSVDTDNLDVQDYSLSSNGYSDLTLTQDHQDLGLSHTTTLTGGYDYENDKTYSEGGDYSWNLSESADFDVEDAGVSGSDPSGHGSADALLHEDPQELAWATAMQGLSGSYSATGSESWSNDQTETGDYSDDSFDQTRNISSDADINQQSTDGDQHYVQTFSPSEDVTVTLSGDGSGEYQMDSTDSVTAEVDRQVTDQSSTLALTGEVDADATIDKSGSDDGGDFNLSTTGDDEFDYSSTQQNQGQTVSTNSDVSEDYTDSNEGDVNGGSFDLSGTLDGSGSVTSTATDQTDTQDTTVISNPSSTLDESGDLYAGEVTAAIDTSVDTTTIGTDTNQSQTVDSTVTTSGDVSLQVQEDLGGGGSYSASSSFDTTTDNDIVTTNGPMTVTDTSTTTATGSSDNDSGDDDSGSYSDGSSSVTATTDNDIVTTNGPETVTDTSTITTTTTTDGDSGNDVDGAYSDSGSTVTTTTDNDVVTTNGPMTITDASTSDSTLVSGGDSGNDIDGDYSDSGSTLTVTTNNDIVTVNGPMTSTDTSTITSTTTTGGDSGNDIAGNYTDSASTTTSTTNKNVVTIDGPQTVTDTSTIDTTITSGTESGNDIDGTYTETDSTVASTIDNNIVTTNGPLTVTDTSTTTSTTTTDGESGDDLDGSYSESGSTTTATTNNNIVTVNGPMTNTDTSTITSTTTAGTDSGNDISGTYTDSASTVVTTVNSNVVTVNGAQTVTDTSTVHSTTTTNGDSGNDVDGTYTDSGSTTTSTANNHVVTADSPETVTDTSTITTTTTTGTDSGNDVDGTYTEASSTTTTTCNNNIVTTDGPETVTDTSTIDTTVTTGTENGDDVDGTYSDSGGTTTVTTNDHIVTTDGPQTTTDTSTITSTTTTGTDSGNDVDGSYTDSSTTTTVTTNDHIVTTNGAMTTTDTSTNTSTTTTGSDSGNDVSGTYSDSSTTVTSTTNDDVVTTDGPETTTDTSTITSTSTSGTETGDDVSGTYSDSSSTATTTAYAHVVTTDGSLSTTDTSTITSTITTGSDSGNDVDGSYTEGSSHSTTTTNRHVVTTDGPQTTTDTSTITTTVDSGTENGNDIDGTYTDSTSTTTTVDNVNVVVATGLMTATTTGTTTSTITSSGSGNDVSGDSNSTTSETDTSDLTKTDAYSDGSDTQTVNSSASSSGSLSSNAFSGDYTQTNSGSTTVTTVESGTRGGSSYSLNETATAVTSSTQTGDSISGDYTLSTSSTDDDSSTRTGSGYSLTQTAHQSGTATTTGNTVAGDYSTSADGSETLTQQETKSTGAESSTLSQTETTTDAISESGNSLTGAFLSTDNQVVDVTMTQTGSDVSGSFSLSEHSHDTPTVATTGNSVDGTQTVITTGDQSYTIAQTNTDGSDNYALSETGSKDYTQTENDNAENGVSSIGETGTDAYTILQNGQAGSKLYTLTVTGTDTYTTSDAENAQTGSFNSTTSGTDAYTRTESGTDAGTPFSTSTSGSNPFSSTEIGSAYAGSLALTQSGTSRYGQLDQFNNTSDAANGGTGAADFSPVGMPVLVQRVSVAAGTFARLGDVAHKYCFAAGTRVLMADGTYKAIEKIEAGAMVLAAPENEPEAVPTACRVGEVYHNAPAALWAVTTASRVDPLHGDTLYVTADHPFYVRERGWLPAKEMQAGDNLRTASGGWVVVRTITATSRTQPVYNFAVEGHHTYFVASIGGEAVLVHNSSRIIQNPVGNFLDFMTGSVFSSWRAAAADRDAAEANKNRMIMQLGSAKAQIDPAAVKRELATGGMTGFSAASTNLIQATSSATSLGLGTGGPAVRPSMAAESGIASLEARAAEREVESPILAFGKNGQKVEFRVAKGSEQQVQQKLAALEAEYSRDTGKQILVRQGPAENYIGAQYRGALGRIDPKTKAIEVYEGEAYGSAARAEELLHYQQLKKAGYLGLTEAQIMAKDPNFIRNMEFEVTNLLLQMGYEIIR